jgi:nucleotide-binding universal stress UspA family protein
MFTHILLPTDGSKLSQVAVEKGIDFAKKINAQITGVFVVMREYALESEMSLGEKNESESQYRAMAEAHLSALKKAAQEAGITCEVVITASDQPYQAIVDLADQKGCDLIMMASHGRRGIGALLLGSETQISQ